ncbi:DUF4197 domain-containing protein [Campylobacter sp.]|uniref:DUF4197 domain-containing protein n=1 Tax=Campylobacter sp. TaxID=205 RepID=UPI002709CF15|nr:DUF4197 domain-containing protein [Campylobacter sp.]
MKKSLVLALFFALGALGADWGKMMQDGLKAVNQASAKSDYKSMVSSALEYAVKELSNDGFIKNATAKIPLPASLQTAANLAKKVGGDKWANDLVVSINKAASSAVPGAADVFSKTIKNMSETDVKKIMSGGNDSFTKFLQENSSKELEKVFKPIIEKMMSQNSFATAYNGLNSFVKNSLGNSQSMKSVKSVASSLGMGEYVTNEGEDLNGYITRKTLDGLFKVMSENEKSLRSNPVDYGKKAIEGLFK